MRVLESMWQSATARRWKNAGGMQDGQLSCSAGTIKRRHGFARWPCWLSSIDPGSGGRTVPNIYCTWDGIGVSGMAKHSTPRPQERTLGKDQVVQLQADQVGMPVHTGSRIGAFSCAFLSIFSSSCGRSGIRTDEFEYLSVNGASHLSVRKLSA